MIVLGGPSEQPRPVVEAVRVCGLRLGLPLLLMGALAACAGDAAEDAPGVEREAQQELLTLEGQPYALGASEEPTLLLFIGRSCPISNALVPEMRRLFADYGQRGVDFRLVYTDRDDSLESLEQHLREYELGMRVLLDFDQQLAAHLGIRVTPEAALVLPGGALAYRGRINDLYADFGVQRSQPTQHDLRLALDAVLAGEHPNPARTEAVGCQLPDLVAGAK